MATRRRVKTFVLWSLTAVMAAVTFGTDEQAGRLEDAFAAHGAGAYATALRIWLPDAERGDATAQNNLGLLYDLGQGVAQDHRVAYHWYGLAAEQGFAAAQNNLGSLYSRGRGVARNDPLALWWFRLAADQGHAPAQHNLGRTFHRGDGVPQDSALAADWYALAAEQGHAPPKPPWA